MSLRVAVISAGCRRVHSAGSRMRMPKQRQLSNVLPSAIRENDAPAVLVGSTSESARLGEVARHGQGDGVIALNVGGKEFYTLRSTVASNAVLADHVVRAEANHEVTHAGKAVFIDRDPTHFGFILQHLRNRVEALSYSNSLHGSGIGHKSSTRTYVQLPKDTNTLRDLYVEAAYYRIPEMQSALCEQNILVFFSSTFSGGAGNPFDTVSTILKRAKQGLLAFGAGTGTIMLTMQQDYDAVLNFFGPQKKHAEDERSEDESLPSEETTIAR